MQAVKSAVDQLSKGVAAMTEGADQALEQAGPSDTVGGSGQAGSKALGDTAEAPDTAATHRSDQAAPSAPIGQRDVHIVSQAAAKSADDQEAHGTAPASEVPGRSQERLVAASHQKSSTQGGNAAGAGEEQAGEGSKQAIVDRALQVREHMVKVGEHADSKVASDGRPHFSLFAERPAAAGDVDAAGSLQPPHAQAGTTGAELK